MRAGKLIAVATVAIAIGSAPIRAGDRKPEKIGQLGAATVGSTFEEVRNYKPGKGCLIENGQADCMFTDSNGVEFIVFGKNVTTVTATSRSKSALGVLPFGL